VILDRPRLRLVAHPGEDLVVEVQAAGAHAADVQRERGPQPVGGPLEIVVGDDAERAADDVEGPGRAARARAGEALGERRGVEVAHRGGKEHGEPAVGDLGGQGHVLRPFGAEVDGDLGTVRMQDRAQRLAQARSRCQRKLIVLAVEADRLLARDDLAQDVHVLPGALKRARVRLAVPPLHHLRVAGADAEQDAALGEVVHCHRRHRQGGRRTRRQLRDRRAKPDARGP
jgi:hypothetical protein